MLVTDIRKISLGAKLKANCTAPMSHNTINLTWYINGEKVTTVTNSNHISNPRTVISR